MTGEEELSEGLKFGFLLGAGCSKEAGIPDMKEFLHDFLYSLKEKNPAFHDFITDLLEGLKDDGAPDLEDLMVSLDTIAGNLPYSRIVDNIRPLKSEYKDKSEIATQTIRLLEEFISNSTFVNDASNLYYINGLLNLIRDLQYYPPIFTVNYDTVLEFIFEHVGITYSDGFEPYWDPDLFDKESQINLFKLHGSCTWYSSGSSYIRLPIKPTSHSVEVLGLGEARSMVLYPSFSKNRLAEPLSVLLGLFRKSLGNLNALFVVGYSCRDEDIALVMAEALRVNPSLKVFIISPNPRKGIQNLHAYDERLGEACIGISTTWSLLLSHNRIGRIIEDMLKGVREYNDIKIQLRYGETYQSQNFHSESRHLLRSFQYDELYGIYLIIKGVELPDTTQTRAIKEDSYAFVMSSLGLLYEAVLMGRTDKVSQYAQSLLDSFDVQADSQERGLTFKFLVESIPDEMDIDQWIHGETSYRIDNIMSHGLEEWARWVHPFLHSDELKKTLLPLTKSINNYHDDYEFLRYYRSYLIQKEGEGSFEQAMKRIEEIYPRTSQRLNIKKDIDDVLRIELDKSDNRYKQLIDDNPWLILIYHDMIEQINEIVNILQLLSKRVS